MPHVRSRLASALALFILVGTTRVATATPTWLPGPLSITPSGANAGVLCSTLWDPDGSGPEGSWLVVGGDFTSIEGVAANRIAVRNPHTVKWEPLGGGLDSHVYAMTVYHGELIAAGHFAGKISRWNGTSWQVLGSSQGFNSPAVALCVYADELYAGGYLTTADYLPTNYIARWNGSAWNAVGSGMDGPVWTLASFNGDLVAGGQFSVAGTIPANHIAAWDGVAWHTLGAGMSPVSAGVFSLTAFNGELVAGGNFDHAGGVAASHVARWNGSAWQAMGTLGFGANDVVQALANDNGDLVAGLAVYIASDVTWDGSFARWNGSSWSTVGTMEDKVECALRYDNEWVVGGEFTYAQNVTANHLARFGSQWAPFGGGSVDHVSALIQYRSRLVAGGTLIQPAPNNPANNIVAWDGLNLSSFGTGINGPVSALESFASTVFHVTTYELVAGGYFTQAGGVAANNIARWDETPSIIGDTPAWHSMGAGFSNGVYAIKRFNGKTYAAGGFLFSGSTRVNYIASWNQTSNAWEPLAGGTDGPVYALEVYGGLLHVGGTFTTAGGFATGGLAVWDGTGWSGYGTFPGAVLALKVDRGWLNVGGVFSFPNGGPSNAATLYGGTFSSVGNPNNAALAFTFVNGSCTYMGGQFTSPPHFSALASILGCPLDGGADGNVNALATFHDEVNAGGSFATVGSTALPSTGWARFSESGVPWIVTNPGSNSVSSGGDVMFAVRPATGYTGLTYRWYRFDEPLSDGPSGNAMKGGNATMSGGVISGAHSSTLGIHGVVPGDAGQYKVIITNSNGSVTSAVATLTVDGLTAAPFDPVPRLTRFESLGPNPTSGATQLTFRLAQAADVRMVVHDVAGRLVRAAVIGHLTAGRHTASWDGAGSDGTPVRTGLYFVSLDATGSRIGTRRLVMER